MAGSRRKTSRRRPRQARARDTVDVLLQAAARVFRREGFRATTNRIAAEAGVSIGSLYEYFPDKQALLAALAERHLEVAERHVDAALRETSLRSLLAALQAAIVESQRYPSQALQLVTGGGQRALTARAELLRARVLQALERLLLSRGCAPAGAADRARALFAVVAELTAALGWTEPERAETLGRELLEMAVAYAEQR